MGPNKTRASKIYGDEPKTMDELGFALIKVLNEYQYYRHITINRKSAPVKPKVVGLSWDLRHDSLVSNSHSSPEGYPENFMSKEGIPTGYPGWTGRVWVRYAKDEGYSFGSDPFTQSLTHTGTGGGGSYYGPWETVCHHRYVRHGHRTSPDIYPEVNCFSWDYKIFDADWPELTANIINEFEKARVIAILQEKPIPDMRRHKFLWEDAATKEADEAFIRECIALGNRREAA